MVFARLQIRVGVLCPLRESVNLHISARNHFNVQTHTPKRAKVRNECDNRNKEVQRPSPTRLQYTERDPSLSWSNLTPRPLRPLSAISELIIAAASALASSSQS
jgi:hypothetical protein